MHVFGEFATLFVLHSNEVLQLSHIGIKYGPKLLSTHHLNKCLFVGVWNLRWLFQVHEIFLLALKLITQMFHIFQGSDAFEKAGWLKVLTRLVQVQADCLLDMDDLFKGHVSLAHVLHSFH